MTKHALERGQTLPLAALALVVLVGSAGFAADVGYHQYEQRVQQTATDSAALAAAAELAIGNYQSAGQRDASSNGFTSGANGVSVTIGPPSAGDAYAADPNAVEAQITATYPTFFEKAFGIGSATISTKAVAINNAHSDLCMVALDTSGTSTINAHSTIYAPQCSIAINNSHLSIGGQSSVTTQTPIQYSGSLTGAATSTFLPAAPVSAYPVADPCPQIASCEQLAHNPPQTTPCQPFNAAAIVPNQTYCSIDVSNATITLPPGWYVVTGGITANHATIDGTDVTIVYTSSNSPNVNNGTFNISAPSSGEYAGMLWYAPNVTGPVTMNSGNSGLSGVMYFPKSKLTMNAGTTASVVIIAGELTLNAANTTFSAPSAGQIAQPRLVE